MVNWQHSTVDDRNCLATGTGFADIYIVGGLEKIHLNYICARYFNVRCITLQH